MASWLQTPESLAALSADELRDAHVGLQKDIRLLRAVIPLTCFVVIAGFIYNMYNTYQAIEPAQVVAAFDEQAKRVLPKVQRSAMVVGDRVAPVVSAAFAKQLDRAIDQLAGKLDGEMNKLSVSLPLAMEKDLNRKLEAANQAQEKVLYTAFPELKQDPKRLRRLMASFQGGFSKWAQKTLSGTFARHLKELENIKHTLNGFINHQNAQGSAKAGGKATGTHRAKRKITPDQLLGLWLEIMDEALKDGGDSDLMKADAKAK
ncbi:MAG: hypothetical protein KC502_23510 [Myxococcales bacterium]|nr:hypothetical protein [Myxococcales bacterium]